MISSSGVLLQRLCLRANTSHIDGGRCERASFSTIHEILSVTPLWKANHNIKTLKLYFNSEHS